MIKVLVLGTFTTKTLQLGHCKSRSSKVNLLRMLAIVQKPRGSYSVWWKMAQRKRNDFTLKMKYEVILAAEREPGIQRAEVFDCGKSQIQGILKKKQHYRDLYEQNSNDKMKHCGKRSRKSEFSVINEQLYEWFQLATSRHIYPDGKILKEKALEIAGRLGMDEEFKASNGWLSKWKERYNISQRTISGESGDVSNETVESWLERLPSILEGYSSQDIWNCDETGLFWKALPETVLLKKERLAKEAGSRN